MCIYKVLQIEINTVRSKMNITHNIIIRQGILFTYDNFTSIVAGIEEGRNAYSNIRKISILLLSCGFAEVIFFVLAILFNLPMPLVAIQLLWLNLIKLTMILISHK